MEPIRILHVVTYMGRGGLESMLMNYYRNIDRTKVQFDFLVHRDFEADYDKEILALGGRIFHVSRLIPWSRSYRAELKQFFHEHPEYKIVHVHQDCLSSVALQCAEECGIPVRIAHSHNSNQDKNLKYPIKLFYKRKIPNYTTHYFACGQEAGEWMFPHQKFDILNNAIDAQKYRYSSETAQCVRQDLGIDGKFVVGHVGRFRKQKNHEFLIRIFDALLKKQPDAVLLLVGDGDEEETIRAQVQSLGIQDKVLFLGARSDVPQLMQAMDAFVFPSLYEGFGIVALEAQAAGCPCVMSDQVPPDCVVTELTTQLALKDSLDNWTDAILNAARELHPDEYKTICDSGFDIQKNSFDLQNFYLSQYEMVTK